MNDREAWLRARLTGIGASEMPVLMGLSSWDSIVSIWARKTGREPPGEDSGDELLEIGRALEEPIMAMVCKKANVNYSPNKSIVRSDDHIWCIATPDGLTEHGSPIEVKNIGHGFTGDPLTEQYRVQCHHQMIACGKRECLFGALVWGNAVYWEWVDYDEELAQEIIAVGNRFWGYVVRDEMPPSDGHPKARKVLSTLATDTSSVELYHADIDEQLTEWELGANELATARKTVRELERRHNQHTDALAAALGSHTSGHTVDGWRFEWVERQRKGYTVQPSTSREFKVSRPKERKQ